MKKEDFIGVWKLIRYGEGKIHTSHTHLVVKDDVLWEVHPGSVYYENESGPEVKYTFEQGDSNQPSKVSLDSGFKYLVKMDGDTMLFKLGPLYGYFPENFEDAGNVGEYKVENEEYSKTIGVPPEKVKMEEFKANGLGILKYDKNLNWWTGETTFQRNNIALHISTDEADKYGPLDTVREKLDQLESISFHQLAGHHLLPLFNESWNEAEQDLGADEFEKKISIESITVETDGQSTIWLHDGGLFHGHSIQIELDQENQIVDCGIAG